MLEIDSALDAVDGVGLRYSRAGDLRQSDDERNRL